MKMNFPKTVLLIDDDPEDCEILTTALKECCELVELFYDQDTESAIKRLHDSSLPVPDFVFLDWRMPMVSGAEMLTIIRNQPHYEGIPVIIFTGGYAMYWEEAQKLGASYLLNKPSIMEELIKDLKRIFAQVRERNLS